MSILKILLYPVIFVSYLCIYNWVNHELRLVLSIGLCVITAAIGGYFFYLLFKHENVKEYFWNNLSDEDKELVNYGFHRPAFSNINWKYEVEFQEKRNAVICQCHNDKGNLLISLEKLLSNLEALLFVLIVATSISFSYA